MSFVEEHAEEESKFDKFRCLIESIESAGANSAAEFYSELCSQADHIMETIKKHFQSEEKLVCDSYLIVSDTIFTYVLVCHWQERSISLIKKDI